MDFSSNTICLKAVFTHEEAASIQRYLSALMHGGEMRSHDMAQVQIFMAGLNDHEETIKHREALMNGVQRIADAEFNQLKGEIYQVNRDS